MIGSALVASYNKVILIGRLTRDVELKYAGANGTPIAALGFVVNNSRKGQDGKWEDDPCFLDVDCFGKTAEMAGEKLGKGSEVLVEGRLKQSNWVASDGQKRSKILVVADRVLQVGARSSEPQESKKESTNAPDGGDCPF